jgi:DeoR/GlpR family transcriptional regulator of sugar metabolism
VYDTERGFILRRKKDRTNQILELLTDEERVEVAELSLRLGVSQVTIRKDLDELEQRGIIQREHGCAVLRNGNDLSARIAYHYESKKKIAEKACELVQDGDTIMIENGSCCALLADTLTDTHKDLTIITNSAYIASYLREKRSVQVVLLGGTYQPDAQVMVGPMVRLPILWLLVLALCECIMVAIGSTMCWPVQAWAYFRRVSAIGCCR